MEVKNLEFFDKEGYNLNLNWNEQKQIWEGNIFFPRVSVGLYENTTIYIVEYKNNNTNDDYTYPTDPTGNGNITFQWDLANTFVDEFFMFNFDDNYELKDTSSLIYTPYDGPLCETLIINRFDKYNVPLLNLSTSDFIKQDDLIEVHIAFRSDGKSAETTYKRTLVISYEDVNNTYEIARITFFAETIEEDERLKIWNENLGYNLKTEDSIIFKHNDIHECMPNFKILNEKRKELMLEGSNIYPYIGSYKAILNAIKFFGYDNLNIVEYWRNVYNNDIDFGKIYRTYVYSLKNRKTLSTKRKPITLNTKKFQKLNNISLVYNINHPEEDDGKKYDDYGLPNVIEDFDKDKRDDFLLTIEEALVKLFALRKKLNDEFMPGSTKITDIIGEGNYFGINLIGNNPQISTVNYIESKGYVDFSVFPDKYCYITENEDFARFVISDLNEHVENDDEDEKIHIDENIKTIGDKYYTNSEQKINEIDKQTLNTILNKFVDENNYKACGYYEEYYNITYDNIFGDADKYGLRNIPEPVNVYRDDMFDDENSDVTPDIIVQAKVILKGLFNENIDDTSIIEWKIIHTEKEWNKTFTGVVKTHRDVFVQLPYLGDYDVEMCVWDVYNHCCKQYTKNAITVVPYNIDIKGFYYDARPLPDGLKYDLMIPKEYQTNIKKDYKYYLWQKTNDVDGNIPKRVYKGVVTRKRNPFEMTISDVFGEYIVDDIGTDGITNLISNYVGPEKIREKDLKTWVSIVNTENDDDEVLKFSWVSTNKDGNVVYGIDEYIFSRELEPDKENVPFDENDSYVDEWNKDELYHVIKKNVDEMYSWAIQEHLNKDDINASMRTYKSDGSVNCEGPYYKFDVENILYKIERGYKEYDHLNEKIINFEHGEDEHYKYVRYINNIVDIKPLTWILLGFDYSRITGRMINKEYPKWTLIMLGDELDPDEELRKDKVVTTHYGLYFTYLLEEEGIYKIKLEIKDINDNYYKIEKPIVIVDRNANYEMYHTLKDEYDKYLELKNERNLIYLNQ